MAEHGPTHPTRYCRQCQYVLDGLTENRCPECGTTFEPGDPSTYWRTPQGPRSLVDRTAAAWRDCLASAACLAAMLVLWLLHGLLPQGRVLRVIAAVLLVPFALGFAVSGFREKGNPRSRLACLLMMGLVLLVVSVILAF